MQQGTIETKWGPEHYVLMDATEIPTLVKNGDSRMRANDSWTGGTYADLLKKSELGDNALVEASDAVLRQIEDQIPVSRAWVNVDDVVGAVPNIPAFLAGHPQHMRRRHRVARDTAPLAIYMDLTSSAGINHKAVTKRGTVLLALARMLIEHRAVTLWAGVSQDAPGKGGKQGAGTVAWRIDTAPLDLARSAFHISSTLMSRRFGYRMNAQYNKAGGHWPFCSAELAETTGKERMQNLLGSEVLFVPRIFLGDQLTDDPVAWLKRVMAQYVQTEE